MQIIRGRQETETSKIVFIFAISVALVFSYQEVEANGATYNIDHMGGGDCGLIGTWEGDTCTLTSNLAAGESIEVNGDNITLDGNGNSLSGVDCVGNGISAIGKVNVTIKDVRPAGFNN